MTDSVSEPRAPDLGIRPSAHAQAVRRGRIRALSWVLALAVVANSGAALRFASQQHDLLMASALALAVYHLGLLGFLLRTKRLAFAVHAGCGAEIAVAAIAALLISPPPPEAVWTLPVYPIVPALLLGRRAGLAWGAVTCGLVLAIGASTDAFAYSVAGVVQLLGLTLVPLTIVMVVATEIEHERGASEHLERGFQLLIENLPGAILCILDLRITYANPAMLGLLGAERPEQLIGRPVLDFVRDPEFGQQRLEDAIRTGVRHGTENLTAVTLAGKEIAVEANAVHLSTQGTRAFLIQARDRRESMRREERLREVQKLEALGQLASGVAHDFNNLLTVILSQASSLLEELPAAEPAHARAAAIEDAAERSSELTQQLLAYSGRQVLDPIELDLSRLVEGMRPLVERLLPEDLTLALELAPRLPAVLADRAQLEQVIVNLLVNARDAVGESGRVTIRTRDGPEGRVTLEVEDDGAGIDRGLSDRVFDPFFTTKPIGQGSGLGLATVQGIVRQSGGTVRIESRPGQGTRVIIRLRALPGEARAIEPRPVEAAPARGMGETILLAEDHDRLREVAREGLEQHGYRVVEAHDGQEALERATPDIALLVTDVTMPFLGGIELAARLRERLPTLPVVFITGYATELPDEDHVLEKPFRPAALARIVREALDGRAGSTKPD